MPRARRPGRSAGWCFPCPARQGVAGVTFYLLKLLYHNVEVVVASPGKFISIAPNFKQNLILHISTVYLRHSGLSKNKTVRLALLCGWKEIRDFLDGFFGRALVFHYYFSAVLGDLLGVVGIGKALGHCAEQLFFVVHEDGAVVV